MDSLVNGIKSGVTTLLSFTTNENNSKRERFLELDTNNNEIIYEKEVEKIINLYISLKSAKKEKNNIETYFKKFHVYLDDAKKLNRKNSSDQKEQTLITYGLPKQKYSILNMAYKTLDSSIMTKTIEIINKYASKNSKISLFTNYNNTGTLHPAFDSENIDLLKSFMSIFYEEEETIDKTISFQTRLKLLTMKKSESDYNIMDLIYNSRNEDLIISLNKIITAKCKEFDGDVNSSREECKKEKEFRKKLIELYQEIISKSENINKLARKNLLKNTMARIL